MGARASVLVIDDDPSHLRIYTWIMEAAGFDAHSALVGLHGVDLPPEKTFSVALMDYRLAGQVTAAEVAEQVTAAYPKIPIVLLSDIFGMPDDMESHVTCFVRKGEPERLVATVKRLSSQAQGVASSAMRRNPSGTIN